MDRVTVLITGGAGFIGSNFLHFLSEHRPQYELVNLDKLTYAGNLRNLQGLRTEQYHFVRGDIGNRELVEHLFEAFRPRWVVNFAAESHVDRSIEGPEVFVRTNVYGTQVLLDVARSFWEKERMEGVRFLQVSTDEVYGALPLESAERFTEESPLRPNSPYSASKAGADLLVRAYFVTYGMPVLITRSSNNFGPRQYPEKLIPLMISRALSGRPLPVYGDGKNVRDWLYVEDHCRALVQVLEEGRPGEIYNIGGGNEWPNIDLVHFLCRVLAEETGKEMAAYEKLITFVPDRPGHDRRYALSSEKVARELKWQPRWKFEDALRHTVRWYLANRG
ncbi:MAG: dTDP-glucose 4,6-dehydratase [Candidatus Caldatribacteriaceae bacterium]